MSDYRYYLAEREGVTHTALTAMEKVGAKILAAFSTMDRLGESGELFQITSRNRLLAFTVLPSLSDPERGGIDARYMLYRGLAREVREAGHEIFNAKFKVLLPGLTLVEGMMQPDARYDFLPPLTIINQNIQSLGIRPIISEALLEEDKSGAQSKETGKAVPSTSGGYLFFPEARIVCANWVLKVPYKEPTIRGDNFVITPDGNFIPPDSRLLSSKELADYTMGEDYSGFGSLQLDARKRILGLPKIEVGELSFA